MLMMFLKVVMTLAPGGLEEGEGFEFTGEPPWELGRAPGFGPELLDRSISRKHARITFDDQQERWWIENISGHNGIFVDGEEVAPGSRHVLPDELCHLQLGSVIFELKWLQETRPFTSALVPPGKAHGSQTPHAEPTEEFSSLTTTSAAEEQLPWFELSRDGDCCTVHCKGRLLTMKPSCALALYALCTKPGEVMHSWDVLDVMGGEYDLAQAISGVRRELRDLLELGWLTRAELIDAILGAGAQWHREELLELDDAGLLRKFLMSRRGHGYVLMMSSEKISLHDEG